MIWILIGSAWTWPYPFGLLEWTIRIVMLVVIVLRKENPTICLAWLAVVFFEPFLGLLIYLLVGEIRLGRRRLARRRFRQAEFALRDFLRVKGKHHIDPSERGRGHVTVRLEESVGGLPVLGGNRVTFISDTEEVIDRLIADIDAARHHVHLLFYIYADDEVGERVGDALIRARQRGVICRVLVDAVGSRGLFHRLAGELESAGVEVVPALPVTLWRLPFARIDLRNHRKLGIIDGTVAYTGSQNIVEATYGQQLAGGWHDMMARITGPVTRQLQVIFFEDWFYETDTLIEDPEYFPPATAEGDVAIQVVPTGPDLPTEAFQDLVVQAIFSARRRVTITSPYFVPDEATLMALRAAAVRGLRVEVVVPYRSNYRLVDAASEFYCEHLMRHGVRIFRFRDGLPHGKTMTVDGRLAMFGSANYDVRSFQLNFELNLLIHSPDAVADLMRMQELYLKRSIEVIPGTWPSPHLPGRLKRNLAKLFSRLL
jgi:cardiolipin synthase A/B